MYEYIFMQCMYMFCVNIHVHVYYTKCHMYMWTFRASMMSCYLEEVESQMMVQTDMIIYTMISQYMYIQCTFLCRYVHSLYKCSTKCMRHCSLCIRYMYTCSYSLPHRLHTNHIVCLQIRWYNHYNFVFLHKWSHYLYKSNMHIYNSIIDNCILVCGFPHY